MDSLSDAELKTMLAALSIARDVATSPPSMEESPLHEGFCDLWCKLGTEAIARGLLDVVDYDENVETIRQSECLTESDVALMNYKDQTFRRSMQSLVVYTAILRDAGAAYYDLDPEESGRLISFYEGQFEERLNTTKMGGFVDLTGIAKAPWLE